MGAPGDSPLTDLLHWGKPSEFPEDITLMLLRLKSEAPHEFARLPADASEWTRPERASEARRFLSAALERNGIDVTYYRALLDPSLDRSRPRWWEPDATRPD